MMAWLKDLTNEEELKELILFSLEREAWKNLVIVLQ